MRGAFYSTLHSATQCPTGLGEQGPHGLGITADDSHQTAAVAKKSLKDGNYTLDVPYDNDIVAITGYQVRITPTTVVIGSDGIVKNVIIGFGNMVPSQIGAAVERALAESGKMDAAALIGNPAPAFLLTAPNQAPMRLDDQKYAHKVMVITFWADDNSSASALHHIQELAANRNFGGNGLRVLAVATGRRTPGEVRKFLLDNRYTFDTAFDTPFAAWEESLGKGNATFVIGRDGTVRNVFAGADVSSSNFDGAVASALEHSDDYAFLIGKPARTSLSPRSTERPSSSLTRAAKLSCSISGLHRAIRAR